MDQTESFEAESYEPPCAFDLGNVIDVTLGSFGAMPDGNAFVYYFPE